MRAAPAVCIPIGQSPGWRAAESLLWALAGSALAAWLIAPAGQAAAWGCAVALPVGAVAWLLLKQTSAALAWDGQQWALEGEPVQLTVALDFDRWLLLSLKGEWRRRWLPASAGPAAAQWHACRAALYSRAPETPLAAAAPRGGQPPE